MENNEEERTGDGESTFSQGHRREVKVSSHNFTRGQPADHDRLLVDSIARPNLILIRSKCIDLIHAVINPHQSDQLSDHRLFK